MPTDVDFRVMLTFVEFYSALMGFMNFRLYHSLNLKYPPQVNWNNIPLLQNSAIPIFFSLLTPPSLPPFPRTKAETPLSIFFLIQIEGLPPPSSEATPSQVLEPDAMFSQEVEDNAEVCIKWLVM